jgi:hypothetical protein
MLDSSRVFTGDERNRELPEGKTSPWRHGENRARLPKLLKLPKFELLPLLPLFLRVSKVLCFALIPKAGRLGPMDTCWRLDKKAKVAIGLLFQKSFTTAALFYGSTE